MTNSAPRWLRFLERNLGWLAVPHIAILLVTLQALGFLMVMQDPIWIDRLALIPENVLAGEYWRLVTFLALPLSLSPIWVILALWFLYFVVNTIENEWGAFRTTLYVLISMLLTIAVSLTFGLAITDISEFQSTLFLAAATLYPEFEIRLFFAIPVKMKWLAWLTLAFLAIKVATTSWLGRLYLAAIYSNYLLFFGPIALDRIKHRVRRWNYHRKLR